MFELLKIFTWIVSPFGMLISFIIWYFFFNDRDVVLAIAEHFGKSVSYYKNKVVWITGASNGLGEALAHELASVGAQLILSSRNEQLLQNVKETCLNKSDGCLTENDILVLPFDITETASHQKQIQTALTHFGKIDIVIDNVGRYQIGNIHSTSFDVMKELFDVNFFGGIHLTQLLLKHFLQRKHGHVIVISSIAGKIGSSTGATYASTKYALHGFYDSLRLEYNNENIGVTIVNPGVFKSSIFDQTLGSKKGEIAQNRICDASQLSTKRCSHLTLVAGANKLFESWISHQPHLFSVWLAQHFPDLFKYFLTSFLTKRRLQYLLDGVVPLEMSTWAPFSRTGK